MYIAFALKLLLLTKLHWDSYAARLGPGKCAEYLVSSRAEDGVQVNTANPSTYAAINNFTILC
jgi:hypothetical protein